MVQSPRSKAQGRLAGLLFVLFLTLDFGLWTLDLSAQTVDTPRLTAKTVRFFVFTPLGACQNGELGFDTNSKLQYCDAGTWKTVVVQSAKLDLEVLATDPAAEQGRIYFNSGDKLIHYSDSTTWHNVPALNIANTFTALQTLSSGEVMQNLTSDPAVQLGRIYLNTTDNRLHYSESAQWDTVAVTNVGQTFSGTQTFSGSVVTGNLTVPSGGTPLFKLRAQAITTGFTSVGASSCATSSVAVTGVSTANFVGASLNGALDLGLVWSAWANAAGNVSIDLCNVTTASITVNNNSWNVFIVGY